MAHIARVAAPGITHHTNRRGADGLAAGMSMVSPNSGRKAVR